MKKKSEPKGMDKKPSNMITILVLTIALAKAILGKTPQTLNPAESQKMIAFMQDAVTAAFPVGSGLLLELFAVELKALMPHLKNVDQYIQEVAENYIKTSEKFKPNENPKA
jgi:hypothetical protein